MEASDPSAMVEETWMDAWRRPRHTSPATRREILAAMRASPQGPASRDPVRLARPGERLGAPGHLSLEDGAVLGMVERLPRDLPTGYHRLTTEGGEQLLLVAPPSCHLPQDLRTWGWAVQLYAARSAASWGIGDLADLRRLAAWSAGVGAGAILVSPLWAPNPGPTPEPSPYFPSTRRFRSALHLAIDEVPGFEASASELAPLARRAHALNADRRIDRAAIVGLKIRALEQLWTAGAGQLPGVAARLAAFRAAAGEPLRQWSLYTVVAERDGPDWRRWPARLRNPRTAAANGSARRQEDRMDFHAWVQWLLDEQLGEAAAAGPAIIGDLPVGVDPGGFDAWTWQSVMADGVSLGAPPDLFNPGGQDWGLPPFSPPRLRAQGYQPFIDTVRSAMRHAGGLRIDHVLGLFRQWWVPAGRSPADGGYVRLPSDELLAILAIESGRAEALVIGEDLGTVAPGVRRRLRSAGILSTRLASFERRPPQAWPIASLGAVTTHDLPTVAGLWTGNDLEDQRRAGVVPDVAAALRLRRGLERIAGLSPDTPLPEAVVRLHATLATARSALTIATLEDALLVAERPNMPGTTIRQRPNWSLALPAPIERFASDPLVARLARAMRR